MSLLSSASFLPACLRRLQCSRLFQLLEELLGDCRRRVCAVNGGNLARDEDYSGMGIADYIGEVIGEHRAVHAHQQFPAPLTIHHGEPEDPKLSIVQQPFAT